MFARLGRWCFRNRGKVALGWLAALVLGGVLANALIGTAYSTEFALPDVESRQGFDILEEHFAGSAAGGEGGTVVFRAEQGVSDPEVQAAMTEFFDQAPEERLGPFACRQGRLFLGRGRRLVDRFPERERLQVCPQRLPGLGRVVVAGELALPGVREERGVELLAVGERTAGVGAGVGAGLDLPVLGDGHGVSRRG